MEYLKIRNWDKWQSYRADRGQPPWIKVHRRLMRNIEWVALSDAERGQLISIWLLAADRDGEVPDDPKLIQKLCHMDKPPNISKFIKLEFILPNGAKPTSERRQNVTPKAEESRTEKKRIYGEFKNVLLTDGELEKLIDKFPIVHNSKIENLSRYIESSGKKYKSHYATILMWSKKDETPAGKKTTELRHTETPDYLKEFIGNIGKEIK